MTGEPIDVAAEAQPASHAIIAELARRSWSLGVAESLTGGMLLSALIDTPGASRSVRGGVVAYDTHLKHTLVGVDEALLEREGAVHPEVAAQLADRVRRTVSIDTRPADVGVGTTGVAGPDPQDGQAVGTVYIGVSIRGRVEVHELHLDGDRAAIRRATVDAALTVLLDALRTAPNTAPNAAPNTAPNAALRPAAEAGSGPEIAPE